MTAFIEAHNVSSALGERRLVADVNLRLSCGRLTVMIGPNGAGKSTLLKLLAGELPPTAGEVLYGTSPLTSMPPWRLACQRSVMTQAETLAFPFSVREVVRLGLDIVGRSFPKALVEALVAQCLAAAGVLHLTDRSYGNLSGGERRRTQFARALCQLKAGRSIAGRQAIFLDEPIANLDLLHQLMLMDAIRSAVDQGAAAHRHGRRPRCGARKTRSGVDRSADLQRFFGRLEGRRNAVGPHSIPAPSARPSPRRANIVM